MSLSDLGWDPGWVAALAARDDPKLRDRLRAEQRRIHRQHSQARRHWRKG